MFALTHTLRFRKVLTLPTPMMASACGRLVATEKILLTERVTGSTFGFAHRKRTVWC